MHFEVRHRFEGASREDVEALYLFDDAFNEEAFARIRYSRSLLERVREGDTLRREIRMSPQTGIPAPFSSLVPSGTLDIVEKIRYDLARHRGTWELVPNVLPGRFRSGGTFAITEEGGAVSFTLEGDTTVNVPLVGDRAAKQSITMAKQNHEALASAVRERLTKKR